MALGLPVALITLITRYGVALNLVYHLENSMPKTGSTAPPAATKKNTSKPGAATARNSTKPGAAVPVRNAAKPSAAPPSGSALEIKDTRTSKNYSIPVAECAIRATELKKIKTEDPNDSGLMSYDPAFLNTASCRSAITYIDGDKGILRYRGYPIEQLAENCSFLEVAYLLLNGELPDVDQLANWNCEVMRHTMIHENVKKFMDGFHHDAHPMGILLSTVAA